MAHIKFSGVTSNGSGFKAQLARKGKMFYLGTFESEIGAAQAHDRATLLTRAWTDRRHGLNFDESEKPADDKLSSFEKQMMEFLRDRYPEAEQDHRNRSAADFFTPDVLLRDFDTLSERGSSFFELLGETLRSSERTIRGMAAQLAENQALTAFYKDKVASLEETVVKLRGIRTEDGKSKIKFTPVSEITPEQYAARAERDRLVKIEEEAALKKEWEEFEAEKAATRAAREEEARLAAESDPVTLPPAAPEPATPEAAAADLAAPRAVPTLQPFEDVAAKNSAEEDPDRAEPGDEELIVPVVAPAKPFSLRPKNSLDTPSSAASPFTRKG